jgi:acyl-CoA hydrolase
MKTEYLDRIRCASVGNSASFAILADKVIVEINLSQPTGLEGLHDVWIPRKRPMREPIPIMSVEQRVGSTAIEIPPEKIVAIVISDQPDSTSSVLPPDEETAAIAGHLVRFFEDEILAGRLTGSLLPLQAGIGTIANAVLAGFVDSPFHHLTMYSEVLQDSTVDLFDAGTRRRHHRHRTWPGGLARAGAARARRRDHREMRGRAVSQHAARLRGRSEAARRADAACAGEGICLACAVSRDGVDAGNVSSTDS